MSGEVLNNELLNYNEDVIRDLQHKFDSLDSIEYNENLNNLQISEDYFIDDYLTNILKKGS